MSRQDVRNMWGYLTAEVNTAAGANTDTELVALVANKIIVIDYIEFSTDTAMNTFLETGTTQLGAKKYLGANGAYVLEEPYYRSSRGASITFTNSASSTNSIYVQYHLEGN